MVRPVDPVVDLLMIPRAAVMPDHDAGDAGKDDATHIDGRRFSMHLVPNGWRGQRQMRTVRQHRLSAFRFPAA